MAGVKIRSLLTNTAHKTLDAAAAADQQTLEAARGEIDTAVNDPVNANQRISTGILRAVDEYNAVVVNPNISKPLPENNQTRIDRLERTLKELCRAQMSLPKDRDFADG